MVYNQEPPFAVQVELAEGCQLRCPFCGINGIRTAERTYKFMTEKTACRIANQMAKHKWNARIEFAMHGEPTMNPDAATIVGIFRAALPRASMLMLSNGGNLTPERVDDLMAAGLNTLGLDEYQNVKLVPKLVERLSARVAGGYKLLTYPDQPEGNPHARQTPNSRRVVHIRPIDLSTSGTHANLNNHAGAGAPKSDKGAGKPCAKPFRELSFRWDGSVAVCCNDWRGELKVGNINLMELPEIWLHPVMDAARRRLVKGLRDFGPCKGCDALSYRVGLLPDKLGRDTMPKPSPHSDKLLAEAARAKPLTKPVKREWE